MKSTGIYEDCRRYLAENGFVPQDELPQPKFLDHDAKFCNEERTFMSADALKCFTVRHPTPFYMIDGSGLQREIDDIDKSYAFLPRRELYVPFRTCRFTERFELIRDHGYGFYCETPEELDYLCSHGVRGDKIRYGAISLPGDVAKRLRDLDAVAVLNTALDIPDVLPRRVDFTCLELAVENRSLTCVSVPKTRFGLNAVEISRLIPFFREIGAESFGLVFRSFRYSTHDDTWASKLIALRDVAAMIEKRCGVRMDRFDLESGSSLNYERFIHRTDPYNVAMRVKSVLKSHPEIQQTICLMMDERLLAQHAIFVASVIGGYCTNGTIIIVNADNDAVKTATEHPPNHVSIAGKEWRNDRNAYYLVGKRPQEANYFREFVMLRPAEKGDVVIFHDIGQQFPDHLEYPVYYYCDDGSCKCICPLEQCEKDQRADADTDGDAERGEQFDAFSCV